eukprot:scaffold2553_cov162-Skeletonema_marinoi.AAC.8
MHHRGLSIDGNVRSQLNWEMPRSAAVRMSLAICDAFIEVKSTNKRGGKAVGAGKLLRTQQCSNHPKTRQARVNKQGPRRFVRSHRSRYHLVSKPVLKFSEFFLVPTYRSV